MPSAICRPIRYTGLSEFIAPWNTIARSCQRDGPQLAVGQARGCRSACPSRSVKMTSPPVIRPGGGSSRVAAYARVDLPQPRLAGQAEHLAAVQGQRDLAQHVRRVVVVARSRPTGS